MNLLALLSALTAFVAIGAPPSATKVAEAEAVPKVRQLRVKLAKVLAHSSALPAAISDEARHVDSDAKSALEGKGLEDEAGLQKVLAEFAAFSAHITGRSDQLKSEAASQMPASALEKAKQMLPGLESRVQKVLEHLKADKGPQSPEHAATIATMEQALAPVSGQNAFQRAVALHNSLKAAHDVLEKRTQELSADRAKLDGEIEEQQAYILFMMLKQRRKLPMKAQLALLKRHQFKDCKYAQKLMKAHAASQPLDTQLLAMLPQALADKLAKKGAKGPAGSLAAAGSDGRVQIVSSRMKNVVQNMALELTKAKGQLEQLVQGSDVSDADKKEAKEVLTGLEDVLKKVSSTHDLKSQMDAMTEMQTKLQTWMLKFATSHK